MAARSLGALLYLTLITGCMGPTQRSVEAGVDQAVRESVPAASAAWRSAAQQGAVEAGWLAQFEDPLLGKLVAEAQANNPSLAAAAAGVEQAQALARQAGAGLVPSVDFSLGGSRSGSLEGNSPSPTTALDTGLQVSWEADLWGRIRSGVAQSAASAAAAQADYRFAYYSLAANTANAYFTAIEARQQTRVAKDSFAALEKIGRIVQAQYDEGAASAQDLALSKSDIASTADRVATLEGAARDALRALELLLGRYPAADAELAEQLPAVPAMPPAGLPSELLERRPDLIAAERQVAAAFNAVNQAKAARLPSLGLTASLGGASSSLSDLLDPANVVWRAGTSLLAPLYAGGRLRENVKIANAQQEAVLAQYAGAALQAFADVESNLDQGAVLETRRGALAESEAQAARAYRLADLRYREGEISLVDLLNIQQRLFSAQSSLSSVERLLLQQRVSLNLALGGAWD